MDITEEIKDNIERNSKEVYKRDIMFYGVIDLIKLLPLCKEQECDCKICSENIKKIETLSKEFPSYIKSGRLGKRKLEDQINDIRTHLVKQHGYVAKGIIPSIGAILGILGGTILGLAIGFISGNIKISILICWTLGLVLGYTFGKHFEKKEEGQNKIF